MLGMKEGKGGREDRWEECRKEGERKRGRLEGRHEDRKEDRLEGREGGRTRGREADRKEGREEGLLFRTALTLVLCSPGKFIFVNLFS